MSQNACDHRSAFRLFSHQTDFKTTHSRLSSHDDLVNAGTTQWQSAISISVPHNMALNL